MQDESPNVRLEALTLLGNFVKNSTIGAAYFDEVASSLKDTAPSVRKAGIKILFEAFVTAPDSPKASEACQIVLQLASDSQDHNRELVVSYIRDLWFTSQGSPATSSFGNKQYCHHFMQQAMLAEILPPSTHRLSLLLHCIFVLLLVPNSSVW